MVTVFRNRRRPGSEQEYDELASVMLAAARQSPGFVDFKTFTADGRRAGFGGHVRHARGPWIVAGRRAPSGGAKTGPIGPLCRVLDPDGALCACTPVAPQVRLSHRTAERTVGSRDERRCQARWSGFSGTGGQLSPPMLDSETRCRIISTATTPTTTTAPSTGRTDLRLVLRCISAPYDDGGAGWK